MVLLLIVSNSFICISDSHFNHIVLARIFNLILKKKVMMNVPYSISKEGRVQKHLFEGALVLFLICLFTHSLLFLFAK